MDLDELIERLVDLRKEVDGKVEVAIAYQPRYPMGSLLKTVVLSDDDETTGATVYLAGSESNFYIAEAVADKLQAEGWS